MIAFHRKLTGKEPTADEAAELPAWCARVSAKTAEKEQK